MQATVSKAKRMMSAAIVAMVFAASPTESSAALFGFDAISDNSGPLADVIEDQFLVDVTFGGGDLTFTFYNVGTSESSIAQIYFDGVATGEMTYSSKSSSAGVDFCADADGTCANPGELPEGNTIAPPFTSATFSFGAVPPPSSNGINNTAATVLNPLGTEFLTLVFALNDPSLANGILTSLAGLRMGLHVISIGRFSDAFVTNGVPLTEDPPTVVPEPTSMLLLGTGLAGIAAAARRRRKQQSDHA